MFHCLLKTSPKREQNITEVFTVTLYFSCALFNLNITVNKELKLKPKKRERKRNTFKELSMK